MAEFSHPLLIISGKVLLQAEDSPLGATLFRRLAYLTRGGWHLLLTLAEPDQWFPTRGSVDDVLGAQSRLQGLLQDAGGDLDGIYYVTRSVFTQDRKRTSALTDILGRYKTEAGDATLISSSRSFVKAADRLGIQTHSLASGEPGMERFREVLEALPLPTAPRQSA